MHGFDVGDLERRLVRLQATGVDPKCAIALRLGERSAAELAGIPDTPELRASDAAPTGPNSSEAKDRLDRKIARIADRMVELHGSLRVRRIGQAPPSSAGRG